MAFVSSRFPYLFRPHRGTIALAAPVALFLLLLGCEKLIELAGGKPPIPDRYIRLRENQPNLDSWLQPDLERLAYSDSLESRPYRFRTDDNGFVAPVSSYPNPALSVVFLGGSTTKCAFVQEELRFPYVVGELMAEASGKPVASFNHGVSGNHSMHSLDILVNKILPMNPDVVVMSHDMNDLVTLLYEDSYWNRNPSRSLVATHHPFSLRRISRFLRFSLFRNLSDALLKSTRLESRVKPYEPFDEFRAVRGKAKDRSLAPMALQFESSLQNFIDITRTRGIQPVLMTQQNRIDAQPDRVVRDVTGTLERDLGLSYLEFRSFYLGFNASVRKVAGTNDVLLIDLERMIPHESRYMYDLIHFNDEGSQLAARIIADRLLAAGW